MTEMIDESQTDDRPARQSDITNHERRITRLETNDTHRAAELASIQVTIRTELSDIKQGIADLQNWQSRAFKIAGAIGAATAASAAALVQHYLGT